MTEKIDMTRTAQTLQNRKQEELQQRLRSEKESVTVEDRVSLSQSEETEATYGPQSVVNIGSNYELLRNLVVKTLQEQNVPLQISTGSAEIDINSLTVEDAQELISEDGYFGVEKTSQRIVDFAINAFGQDPEKLEQMKAAIEQGFKDAEDAFGGALPEISQQTYETVMQKLDAFALKSDETGE